MCGACGDDYDDAFARLGVRILPHTTSMGTVPSTAKYLVMGRDCSRGRGHQPDKRHTSPHTQVKYGKEGGRQRVVNALTPSSLNPWPYHAVLGTPTSGFASNAVDVNAMLPGHVLGTAQPCTRQKRTDAMLPVTSTKEATEVTVDEKTLTRDSSPSIPLLNMLGVIFSSRKDGD